MAETLEQNIAERLEPLDYTPHSKIIANWRRVIVMPIEIAKNKEARAFPVVSDFIE